MSELSYGTVVGRLLAIVGDGTDPDTEPDQVPLSGSVVFTAVPQALMAGTLSPDPATLLPQPVRAILDTSGYLTVQGARGVELQATDDASVNPIDWVYQVTFFLVLNGRQVARDPFFLQVPGGVTTDLTLATPADYTPGTITVVGPGVAPGGAAGQYLVKRSSTDYDTGWQTLPLLVLGASDPVPPGTPAGTAIIRMNA